MYARKCPLPLCVYSVIYTMDRFKKKNYYDPIQNGAGRGEAPDWEWIYNSVYNENINLFAPRELVLEIFHHLFSLEQSPHHRQLDS
jgi:hypothetical protein